MLGVVFHPDLFTVAGTVIPIVLIALNWQSTEWIVAKRYAWREFRGGSLDDLPAPVAVTKGLGLYVAVPALVAFDVLSVVAEIVAVVVLADRAATPGQVSFVEAMLIVQMVGLFGALTARYVSAVVEADRKARQASGK